MESGPKFGADPWWRTGAGRAGIATFAVVAGCLAVTGCGAKSAHPEVPATLRPIVSSLDSRPLMNQLTAALRAKKRDQFLALFAAPAKSAAGLWWDNLAALGSTTGAAANTTGVGTINRDGDGTLTIAAGTRNALDPVNADLHYENDAPATEYTIGVHLDLGATVPIITSWTSREHAPWDEGKKLYVRKVGPVVVAGYAEEKAAVDKVATAATKAADYDISLYKHAAPDLLNQPGFVVFTSASLATRTRWFTADKQTNGWISEPDGKSVPLTGVSTRSGDPAQTDSVIAARVVVRPDLSAAQETAVLVHEFVHANLASRAAPLYDAGDASMPAWISEGIARLVEDTYRSSPDPTRQTYSAQVLKDALASTAKSKLTGVVPTDKQLYGGSTDGGQWYDVAASVYYYIGRTYGLYKAFAAAQLTYGGGGLPFENVVKSSDDSGITMYQPTVVQQGWKNWLAQTYR